MLCILLSHRPEALSSGTLLKAVFITFVSNEAEHAQHAAGVSAGSQQWSGYLPSQL